MRGSEETRIERMVCSSADADDGDRDSTMLEGYEVMDRQQRQSSRLQIEIRRGVAT